MKKLFRIILISTCIAAVFMFAALSANAAAETRLSDATQPDSERVEQYNFAVDFVRDYLLAFDCYEEFNPDGRIKYEALENYLLRSIEINRYNLTARDIVKENVEFTFTPIDYGIDGEDILLCIGVKMTYNYKGDSLPAERGSGVGVALSKKADGGYLIADINADNQLNLMLRGISGNVDGSFWATSRSEVNSLLDKYYSDICGELGIYEAACERSLNKMNEVKENGTFVPITTAEEQSDSGTRSTYQFNRNNMVSYAIANCGLVQPNSGNPVLTQYYNFYPQSGYDCTNFISHVLLSGGTPMKNTGNQATGWYFYNISNLSYSWSSVNNLFTFITTNNGTGPFGSYMAYAVMEYPNYSVYQIGDIIQIDYIPGSTGYDHSTVITSFKVTPNIGIKEPRITSRTRAGYYHNDELLYDAYPNGAKRIIKLTGYRN